MSSLEKITEADLRNVLTASSLRRARQYISRVKRPVRSRQTLSAMVRGTRPYQVEIDVESTGIIAQCACPYDSGGYCKHIGAVLLKWIQNPVSFSIQDIPAAPKEYPIQVVAQEPSPTYQPDQVPFWLDIPFVIWQQASQQQLRQWLNEIKLQDLRQIAKRRNWHIRGTRKAAVVQQIVERMVDPEDILGSVLELDSEHREVLCALVLLDIGDHLLAGDLDKLADLWGDRGRRNKISTHTRHLVELGLALPGLVMANYPNRRDFVPYAIVQNLPPMLDGLIPTVTDLSSDQTQELADPYPFLRTVNQVAFMLAEQRPPLSLRPPMPRPRLETFYSMLKEWDYDPAELLLAKEQDYLRPYSDLTLTVPPGASSLPDDVVKRLAPVAGTRVKLEFIFSLLVATGIFQPGSPLTVWPEVQEQFLYKDELTQRAILARVYFQMNNWTVLWDLLRATGALQLRRRYSYYRPEHLRADLVRFRHLVLRSLASLPDGEWVVLDDLFRLMFVLWPRFDQSVWELRHHVKGSPNWFLASGKSGEPLRLMETEGWDLAQGGFIRRMIAGPLHWLGLADLCWDNDRLTAVRFHGLVDLYWNRAEAPPAPPHVLLSAAPLPEEAVTVDELTISVIPSVITPKAHRLLDAVARLESATAERFVYRLDPQAVYESFEAGGTLAEMVEDWERFLPITLPVAVREHLTDWWNAYGQVRIYQDVTVIEFGDDYALAEMRATTSLEKHLIAEISPRLVIIPRRAIDSLTAELESAGYTPKQTDRI